MGDLGPGSEFKASQRATLPSLNPTNSFWQVSYPNELVNHRSTPDLPADPDVVVVGSGISAAFAVRELLSSAENIRVLVLEARTTCSGATGRNGGHLMPLVHDQVPHIIDFEMQTFHNVEKMIRKHEIPCDFRRLSGCVGFWNETYFNEAKAALAKAHDTDPRHATLVEIVEDPRALQDLRLKNSVGALVQSVAASLSPYKLVIWMWQDMLSRYPKQLNLQTNTPVYDLGDVPSPGGGTIVRTSRGAVEAKHVIVASNGYTSWLLPEFAGVITPTQGQMSASKPDGTYLDQLLPHSYGFLGVGNQDRVMSDYLVQAPLATDGHLMFGGGRACVPNHGVGISDDSYVDPDTEDYLRHLPRRFDLGSPSIKSVDQKHADEGLNMISSWTGIMGYSKDHLPWVGEVPDRPGIWMSAGFTGHGMTNAPGCGHHVARLVSAALSADENGPTRTKPFEWQVPKEYLVSKSRLLASTNPR